MVVMIPINRFAQARVTNAELSIVKIIIENKKEHFLSKTFLILKTSKVLLKNVEF